MSYQQLKTEELLNVSNGDIALSINVISMLSLVMYGSTSSNNSSNYSFMCRNFL